jgi:organic hydroperoxide reductase OsmC/OhrA
MAMTGWSGSQLDQQSRDNDFLGTTADTEYHQAGAIFLRPGLNHDSTQEDCPMTEEAQFTINLEHLEGFEFKVKFDWDRVPGIILDEPAPLGSQKGANAARLLTAAVANCLSASLMYCVSKHEPAPSSVTASATCKSVRNEKGRLRIGGIDVRITVDDEFAQSPRLKRCSDRFEEFCVVTASIRQGIPVEVEVCNSSGEVLHKPG